VVVDDLLERAQRGDRCALEELCQREWRSVYAIAYHALGDVAEAQDLTQEAFLRALRSLDRDRATRAPFRAWIATIARNLIRDGWRGHRPVHVALDHAFDLRARDAGPERLAINADERERLLTSLDTLPTDYQTVIRLRIFDGLSAESTGQIMGRSAGAIRQLQHRALTDLRAALTEESPT
jgi:RNA polymerase sigma-70 factor (ECF subfamily)